MSPHDRHLAGVTMIGIAGIIGLAFAPFAVLVSVLGLIFVVGIAGALIFLARELLRETDATDRYCAWADEELDRREALAQERAAGSTLRVQHTVLALPQARIYDFPNVGASSSAHGTRPGIGRARLPQDSSARADVDGSSVEAPPASPRGA